MDKKQILDVAKKYYRLGYKKLAKFHNAKLEAPYYTRVDYLSDLYLFLSTSKSFSKFDKSKMSLYRYMNTFIIPKLNNKLAAATGNYLYKSVAKCMETGWKTKEMCPIDKEDVYTEILASPNNKEVNEKFNKEVLLYATNKTLQKSQKINNGVCKELLNLKDYCEGKTDIEDINKYITKNTRQQLNRVMNKLNIKIENLAINKIGVL